MLDASALLDTLSTTIPLVPPFSLTVCAVVLGMVPLIPSKDWTQPLDAHREPPSTVTPANNLSFVPFLSSLKGNHSAEPVVSVNSVPFLPCITGGVALLKPNPYSVGWASLFPLPHA